MSDTGYQPLQISDLLKIQIYSNQYVPKLYATMMCACTYIQSFFRSNHGVSGGTKLIRERRDNNSR